jgi:hypothetical protein
MPSTYTLNNGIELIGTGEQSGTWGDTTNTNLELLDTALDGQVSVTLAATGSSGSPNTLPISDGASSNGRNRLVIFGDGGDLGGTAFVQLTPNDAEKIIYVRNNLSGSRSILLFQGTYSASNDYEVPAGTTAVVFFNGAGTGAVAANVFNNAYFDSLRLGSVSVTAILDEDNMASDSATALATQQSIKAYVDTQVGANNELSEVLANGNTTGGTDIAVSTGDDITFADSSKAIFGAGSDLQIYHDGSNSYVKDNGTGDLYLQGTANVRITNTSGQKMFLGQDGGEAQLYYSGVEKLATTSTGVDITGTLTSDVIQSSSTGSASAPAYSFDGHTTAGFYRPSGLGSSIGVATSGVQRALFASNGDISFYEDTGTTPKFFWSAADERLGIGTSSPSGSGLHIRKDTSATTNELLRLSNRAGSTTDGVKLVMEVANTSGNGGEIGTVRDGGSFNPYMYFSTSAGVGSSPVERMRIDSSGNVGIGTSSPNSRLTLSTGDKIFVPTGEALNFGHTDGSTNTERMRIDSSGNVGIGTSSPTGFGGGFIVSQTTGSSGGYSLQSSGSVFTQIAADSTASVGYTGTRSNHPYVFTTNNTERMRIDSSGNVGIGESNPVAKMHIQGSGTSGQVTSSLILENSSSGTAGLQITGSAGVSHLDFMYGGGPSTGTNTLTTGLSMVLEGSNAGNVGIGTSSPSNGKLEVTHASSTVPAGFFRNTSGSGDSPSLTVQGGANNAAPNFSVLDYNGTTDFVVQGAGNVGIGASSPSTPLHIESSTGNAKFLIEHTSPSTGTGQVGHFIDGNSNTSVVFDSNGYYRFGTSTNPITGAVFAEAMRIDSSGNLLVGTTDDTIYNNSGSGTGINLQNFGNIAVARDGNDCMVLNRLNSDGGIAVFRKDGAVVGSIGVENDDLTIGTGDTGLQFRDASDAIRPFNMSTDTVRDAAIDLGRSTGPERFRNIFLSSGVIQSDGGESVFGGGSPVDSLVAVSIQGASSADAAEVKVRTNGKNAFKFRNSSNSDVGSITVNASSTAYNTSSDYRLKTDAQPMTGATDRLKQLNPVNFEWIADGTRVDGFLAHEAQAVVPEAVTGAKDAMRDEEYEVTPAVLDDDGNVTTEAVMGTRSVPDYQGIDQSKLVPLLTAALQEALTKIDDLETRLTALEAV